MVRPLLAGCALALCASACAPAPEQPLEPVPVIFRALPPEPETTTPAAAVDGARAPEVVPPVVTEVVPAELPPVLATAIACDDGTVRDCYGWPTAGPTALDATCTHGLSTCLHGGWSPCAIDSTFLIPRAIITGATITGPDVCNFCDPTCFTSTDTPTTTDLSGTNSTGVEYSPGPPSGISLPPSTGSGTGGLTDTDGDGVPDVADSYPMDATRDGTRELGGFYHTLAAGTTAPADPLVIMTTVRTADIYFLMDTTGSMGGEIANLKSTLTSTIIPSIMTTIPDAWFGVGHFDDAPDGTYGAIGLATTPLHHDWAYENMLDIQASAGAAQTSVNTLGLGSGVDWPESQVPALWAIATGGATYGSAAARTTCGAGTRGYPCFRAGSIPIIVMFTDAPWHNGPGAVYSGSTYAGYGPYPAFEGMPTYDTMVAALNAIGAKVLTIYSGATSGSSCWLSTCSWSCTCVGYASDGYTQAQALATATGTVDSSGTPLVTAIASDGTGLTTAVTTAIANLANYSRMNITLRANDNAATPAVNETLFVQSKAAVATATSTSRCTVVHTDWFEQCLPGTAVNFNVTLANNTVVTATTVAQVFHFTIDVLGNGTYILATVPVTIVVPPSVPTYPASGSYWRDYDSTARCTATEVPRWGALSWVGTYPAGTDVTWEVQTANTAAALPGAVITSWVAPATASPVNVGDRLLAAGQSPTLPFLRVKAVLHASADLLRAPTLSTFNLTFECTPGT